MATGRKSHDVVLPEVRKPAGCGTLVAVVRTGRDMRELWFQHPKEIDILRWVRLKLSTGKLFKPRTIKTTGERTR